MQRTQFFTRKASLWERRQVQPLNRPQLESSPHFPLLPYFCTISLHLGGAWLTSVMHFTGEWWLHPRGWIRHLDNTWDNLGMGTSSFMSCSFQLLCGLSAGKYHWALSSARVLAEPGSVCPTLLHHPFWIVLCGGGQTCWLHSIRGGATAHFPTTSIPLSF